MRGVCSLKQDKAQAQNKDQSAGYEAEYSEAGFWSKLSGFALAAGKEVVENALILFYVAKSEHTPLWAKSVVLAALGYFIATIDAIPDLTPLIGFADDLGVLSAAIASIAAYVNPELKSQVDKKLKSWFDKDTEQEEQPLQDVSKKKAD